jgi:hypothetical protein
VRFFPEESFIKMMQGAKNVAGMDSATGEVRMGKASNEVFTATIEPMHGSNLVVYSKDNSSKRIVIDDNLKEGHALAVADFLGVSNSQVVAGWRVPNRDSVVGIKLYVENKPAQWESYWVEKNGMACEDLKVADLNNDGKPDIIAAGRATHNLKIYWNKSGN